MFCSPNVTSKSNYTSFLTAVGNSCVAEVVNLICFSCFLYVLLLWLIYVQWSPLKYRRGITARNTLLYGHDIRHTLMTMTLILHLTDMGNLLVTQEKSWFATLMPGIAFVSIVVCQIFYYKLEQYGKYRYLIVTITYWVCCGVCRILTMFTAISSGLDFSHVTYCTSVLGVLLYYCIAATDLVTFFLEKNRKNETLSSSSGAIPNDRCAYKYPFSNWYSKVSFCWLTPMLHLGYDTSLQSEHFGVLPQSERAAAHCQDLRSAILACSNKVSGRNSVNLWRCFTKCYWKTFVFGGCLKLIGDILGMVPPIGISVVVNYIEILQRNKNSTQNNLVDKVSHITWMEFLQNGYIMAVVVLLMVLGQGTLSQNSTHIINAAGIRLKNALHGIIYQKLLKIQKIYLKEQNSCDNVGYVTNLITEDTYNIMSCFWIGNYIWAIPLKIIVLIYLLYRVVGISAVVGSVISILIMLIVQFVIGRKMSQNYKSIADWGDQRLRRINEILQGIRFIKLCGWETDFEDDVNEMRKNELNRLNLDSVYWTVITFLANTSSIIIAVISLTLHYYLLEEPITLSSLFASLALFNQLTVPLFIFPVMLPIIVSAIVSTKRIEKLLSLPEITISREIKTKVNPSSADVLVEFRNNDSLRQDEYDDRGSIRLRKITENSENEEDSKTKCNEGSKSSSALLKIKKLVVSWGDKPKLQLHIGDITIYRGTLNVIIGKEGSGKSSLLAALLEEMTSQSGKLEWKRGIKVGYVPQTPWLLNGSLKQNIVFGLPYYEKHFLRVVQMCALKTDINSMPNKENTMVGDRGMTLSGGQKQRVMIARMLYSNADLLLMDNPFSSLDSKITNYIFENGIKKLLSKQNKTIIMSTNFKKYLTCADQVIVMENCRVKAVGSLKDVQQKASKEIQGLTENTFENITSAASETVSNHNVAGFVPFGRRRSTLSGSRYFTHDLLLPTDDCEVGPATISQKQKRSRAATVTEYPHTPSVHRNVFRVSSLQTNHHQQGPKKKPKCDVDERFVFNRHRSTVSEAGDEFDEAIESNESNEGYGWKAADTLLEKSGTSLSVYTQYATSCGPFVVFVFFILTFVWQILRVVADFWLSHSISLTRTPNPSHEKQEVGWHLYSYILLSIIAAGFSFFSTAIGQYGAALSRKRLHSRMLNNILKCSPSFFDATPFAQIIDRFSTDTEITDKKISTSTQRLIQFQLLCTSAILVNCFVTPWFIIVVIPISLIYYTVQRFYRCSSRKLQRLENVLKIPVVDHFSETFAGLEIIRAFDRENSFTKMLMEKIDQHTNVFLILNSTNRWLGIMLDYLGGIIVSASMFISMLSITLNPDLGTSTFFGLAINYTLLIPIYLTWVVKFSNDLEVYMGAVDRICSYANVPTENYNAETAAPVDWPIKGEIRFENVTLRYCSQGRSVVQNMNLRIESGQKVGICGRTGSGKSSLIMSLLKMVPLVEGKLIFDQVNIDDVPLQLLRSKISVVSQDVILFGGSVRQNLDLRGEFGDEELWRSLRLVQIHELVATMGGLDARVQDGGSNLSVGERQSICLARAILRNTSCLILDEATNALQPEAEIDFLNLVLKIFHNQTIIVITHRISSLLHFDRILVLNNGVLVEDGTPNDLVSNKIGQFYSLLKITQDEPSVQRRFLF